MASGNLIHRRRRCEDSRLVTLADVQEFSAHPAFMQGVVLLAIEDDDLQGFAAASVDGEQAARTGRLHFFVVRPGSARRLGEQLLDRLLSWFVERRVEMIRQARLDPISGVLRVEQDRDLIELFCSRGFAQGPVAGNMEADVQTFRWTDQLQAKAEAAEARGIAVRPGCEEDVRGIQALNQAEGLPEWDYHLQATTRASRFDLLVVAERCRDAPVAGLPADVPPAHLNKQIVGYANYFASCWETELPEFGPLLVASAWHRMGLGSVLTARALQYARAHGKRRVRLSTMTRRFDFYRALGFEVTVTWLEKLWKSIGQ